MDVGLALGFLVGAALLLMVGDGELLTAFLVSGVLVRDGSALAEIDSPGVEEDGGSAETLGEEGVGSELGAWLFEVDEAQADTEITETKEMQSLTSDVSFLLMNLAYLVYANN